MFNKLTKCRVCGKDVADNALICPHCGAKRGLTSQEQGAIVAIIIVVTLFAAILIIRPFKSSTNTNTSTSTYSQEILIDYNTFTQIRNGMTYKQVEKLIGKEGTLLSSYGEGEYNTFIMQWNGYGTIGANATVTFQNNKVISKAQFGLK